MKKRLLFVDDEPLVLQGLQRMLRSARHEWDMVFVASAEEALTCLAQQPFDVVVSDMRMPGMDGAELLNEVMKRHPHTVRFVLSGHADRDLVMRCVAATHQYLSKPCDTETLRSTIRRTCEMQASLQGKALRQLIGQISDLPSLPRLYNEIVERLRDPEVGADDVGEIIGKDLAMTAKVLKLVNSAFFGLGREIASPAEAVCYLGVETIKSLVLTLHAFGQMDGGRVPVSFMNTLWGHSLETAAAARAICEEQEMSRRTADESFAAGMLHDIGKLILIFNFPAKFHEAEQIAARERIPIWQAELQVFGASHADVGGYLMGLWGLPGSVVEAIALHHTPEKSDGNTFTPLTATHVGDVLAHKEETRAPTTTTGADVSVEYLNRLHLADRLTSWRVGMNRKAGHEMV